MEGRLRGLGAAAGAGVLALTTGLGPWVPEGEVAAAARACECCGDGILPGPDPATTGGSGPLPTHTEEGQRSPAGLRRNRARGGVSGRRPRLSASMRAQGQEAPQLGPGAARPTVQESAGSRCLPGSGHPARGGCPVREPRDTANFSQSPESRPPAGCLSLTARFLFSFGSGVLR